MLQIPNIQLRVSDLPRCVDFYSRRLGFVVGASSATAAHLAVDALSEPILELVADPGFVRPGPDAAGLFHAALLFADRADLGAWLRHAGSSAVEFDGFADHGVSEALYFRDP